jgi:hypothetical protein
MIPEESIFPTRHEQHHAIPQVERQWIPGSAGGWLPD